VFSWKCRFRLWFSRLCPFVALQLFSSVLLEHVPSVFTVELNSCMRKMDVAGSKMFITLFKIVQSHNPEDHSLNCLGSNIVYWRRRKFTWIILCIWLVIQTFDFKNGIWFLFGSFKYCCEENGCFVWISLSKFKLQCRLVVLICV
jgi:hypothetical protein